MKSKTIEESSVPTMNEEIEEAPAAAGASSARSAVIPVERVERDGAASRLSSWEILEEIARTGMYLDIL